MLLYHTGFSEIQVPDIRHGRSNADFGQGFYLSPDLDFTLRWARVRRGQDTYINSYDLAELGLSIKAFARDEAWFDYIHANRNGRADALRDYDVIIGPIANDTLYDLYGLTTSGFLTAEQSLKILTVGPEYTQVVLKTDRAAAALRFLRSEIVSPEAVEASREAVKREETAHQERFAKLLMEMVGE